MAISPQIHSTPNIQWTDANGQLVSSSNGIDVGAVVVVNDTDFVLTLDFDPLDVTHTGEYTCQATLYSFILESPLVSTVTTNVVVESK